MVIPGRPIVPDAFQELKAQLQLIYPPGFFVQKCQGLGPATVEARGKLGDLIGLPGSGLRFFKAESLKKLNERGIAPIDAYPVRFEHKSKVKESIVEGHTQCLVSFANRVYPNGKCFECPICGGNNIIQLDIGKTAIKKSSIPSECDFLAVKQWGDMIIVTERFKAAAEGILCNAEYLEVPVVDE